MWEQALQVDIKYARSSGLQCVLSLYFNALSQKGQKLCAPRPDGTPGTCRWEIFVYGERNKPARLEQNRVQAQLQSALGPTRLSAHQQTGEVREDRATVIRGPAVCHPGKKEAVCPGKAKA